MAAFEKRFMEKTANKWNDRDYFRQKPGKYCLMNKEKKKKELDEAFKAEDEFKLVVAESEKKYKTKLDPHVYDLVDHVTNLKGLKETLKDMGIDLKKVPIGRLTLDKLSRANSILAEIQRLLTTQDKKSQISTLVGLTNDFYACVPHDFGFKVPAIIDHLLRVKEKTK